MPQPTSGTGLNDKCGSGALGVKGGRYRVTLAWVAERAERRAASRTCLTWAAAFAFAVVGIRNLLVA